MQRTAPALLAGLLAGPAFGNCPPPYSTMFACEIAERDARVEFCQIADDARRGDPRFTYNYTVGNGPAELFFTTDESFFSTKYYDDNTPGRDTTGIGLPHGNYVYAVFLTGEYLERADSAQIHVYKGAEAFQNDKREIDIERRYCTPGTIRVNWDNIAP